MSLESINHIGLPAVDEAYTAELAAKVADQPGKAGNLLLAEQATRLLQLADESPGPIYDYVASVRDRLRNQWEAGELLRWYDLPTAGEGPSESDRLGARLHRNLAWAEQCASGIGRAAILSVPAFNEEHELPYLFESINHPINWPLIAVVVADNNSWDRTAEVIRQNANRVAVATQGVGPAREGANQHGRRLAALPLGQIYFIGTDADATYSPGYIGTVIEAFTQPGNEQKVIANGRISYRFYWPDRPTTPTVDPDNSGTLLYDQAEVDFIETYYNPETGLMEIDDFASYAYFTGTRTFRQCFAELGYDIEDFIEGQSCGMLPGPNTTFRGDLDEWHLPTDQRWEQHDAALKLQTRYRIADIGLTIAPGDRTIGVTSSARAFIEPLSYQPGQPGIFSIRRHQEIRRDGIVPYKSGGGQIPELPSFALTIADIQRQTYGLRDDQVVTGYHDSQSAAAAAMSVCSNELHGNHSMTEALHPNSTSRKRNLGKVAVIAEGVEPGVDIDILCRTRCYQM